MPTYEELVELSNGELTRCIQIADDVVVQTRHEHQPTFENELICQAYANERLKRINLVQRKSH